MHENFNTKIIRNTEAKELNIFYWSVVIPSLRITIIEHIQLAEGVALTDFDKATIHAYLKQRFLCGGSTKSLSLNEFNDYIQKSIDLIQKLTNGQNSITSIYPAHNK